MNKPSSIAARILCWRGGLTFGGVAALRWLFLLLGIASGGCRNNDKPYLRSPLYREVSVTTGPSAEHERATQVEPYPPPRPYLPDEPSRIASATSSIQAAANVDGSTANALSADFRSPK